MSLENFSEMIRSYRETLGKAHPKRDPLAVLAVYKTCAAVPGISQEGICQASGLKAANVNKIIHQGCKMGWIGQEGTRTPAGEKPVRLTPKGEQVLADLRARCTSASNGLARKKNQKSRGKRAPQQNRPEMLSLFEDAESQPASGVCESPDET